MGRGTRVTLLVVLVALVAPAVGGVAVADPASGTTLATTTAPTTADATTADAATTDATTAVPPNATVSVERVNTKIVRVRATFENANATENVKALSVRVPAADVTESVQVTASEDGTVLTGRKAVTELTGTAVTSRTDLSSTPVIVSLQNESTLGSSRTSLQTADLSRAAIGFGTDGALTVEKVYLDGFADESTVRVTVGSETVNATYEASADRLTIGASTASSLDRSTVFAPHNVSLAATAGPNDAGVTRAPGTVHVRAAASDATHLVVTDGALALENPLVGVLDANRYAIDVTTTDPAGRYVDVVNATGGTVPLPDGAIGATLNVTLAVDDSTRQRVLDGWSGGYADRSVDVAVTNGSYVQLSPDVGADAILFEGADGLENVSLNALEEFDRTYALAANATIPTDATVVVLADGGVYSATPSAGAFATPAGNGSEPTSNGAAAVNGSPTTNGTPLNGSATTNGTTGNATPVVGFLPAGYTAINTGGVGFSGVLVGAVAAVGLAGFRSFMDYPVEGNRPTDPTGALIVLGFGLVPGAIVGLAVIALIADVGGFDMVHAALIGGLFGMIGSWPTAQAMAGAGFWGKTTSKQRTAAKTDSPVPVKVQVVTDDNRRVNESVELTARSTARRDDVSGSTSTGRAKLKLKPGTWTITASLPNRRFETTVEVGSGHARSKRAQIVCERPKIAVKLSDGTDGKPLSGATVRVDPDSGERKEEQTDQSGKAGIVLPFAATEATVTVSHPKYVGVTRDVSLDDLKQAFDVSLERKVGSLSVTAEVDGVATGGLPVGVEPASGDDFRARERGETLQTDRDGTASTNLVVGEYVVDLDLPAAQTSKFRTNTSRVTIEQGNRARVSVGATFEYTLPSATRQRLSDVRADVDGLSDRAGRDVAFPRYYGSVVQSLLDVVETLPEQGHRFVDLDASPDAIADAILDVAAAVVPRVNTAMTTKRNVDVFAACADMPDANVEWRGGSASFDAIVERLADPDDGAVTRRIEETKERIDRERGQLTEVEPATEVWELARDLFQEARREEDDVQRAAKTVLVTALLDAVEETFDRDRLRERMKQTVF
jgi:hypothetical protein